MAEKSKVKVLWISNVPPIKIKENPSGTGGGWLAGAYESIKSDDSIEIALAFPVNKELIRLEGTQGGTKYYGFFLPRPVVVHQISKFSRSSLRKRIDEIIKEVNPDILHVFGTEFEHARISIESFGKPEKTVIHIQGMASIYALHCKIGFPFFVRHMVTLNSVLNGTLAGQATRWKKAGVNEIAAIQQVKYVMGRTEWDEACTTAINPKVNYYHCGETLRSSFYDVQWDQSQCVKHSIYFSQSFILVKGLHLVLPVLPQLIKTYPDLHLYIGGDSPLGNFGFKSFLKRSSLGWYVKHLIKKHKLQSHVTFLGSQSENQVVQNLLKAHVFLSASLIENSPNSVGEAMVIGTPVVSSDVGGVKDFIRHGENGFIYPVDEPYMIPYYISKIFEDQELANSFSQNSRVTGRKLYSAKTNGENILALYKHMHD